MLILVGVYLVVSGTLGMVLGRMIRYGTDAERADNAHTLHRSRIFERAPESIPGVGR